MNDPYSWYFANISVLAMIAIALVQAYAGYEEYTAVTVLVFGLLTLLNLRFLKPPLD